MTLKLKIKPINILWTPEINKLRLKCKCGKLFTSPVNRWKAICPSCGTRESTSLLRNILAKRFWRKYAKKEKINKSRKR